MKEYDDLELGVLSCLLIQPKLMNEIILEDKHFVRHQRLWQFMKAFYNKFQTFDVQLMYSICKDKWHIVNYILMLIDKEVLPINFEKYQKQLIQLYEESKEEKLIIDYVYKLANDLYVRSINIKEFKNKIDELYERGLKDVN